MQGRNAHFNLNRLGVTVQDYANNFYGTDYLTDPSQELGKGSGLQSDRLFASWNLASTRVTALSTGGSPEILDEPVAAIVIPLDWSLLVKSDVVKARQEQERVRNEFMSAFANGLICAGFDRGASSPRYLLYDSHGLAW